MTPRPPPPNPPACTNHYGSLPFVTRFWHKYYFYSGQPRPTNCIARHLPKRTQVVWLARMCCDPAIGWAGMCSWLTLLSSFSHVVHSGEHLSSCPQRLSRTLSIIVQPRAARHTAIRGTFLSKSCPRAGLSGSFLHVHSPCPRTALSKEKALTQTLADCKSSFFSISCSLMQYRFQLHAERCQRRAHHTAFTLFRPLRWPVQRDRPPHKRQC